MDRNSIFNSQPLLSEHWDRFTERLTALNERLLRELVSCWRDMQTILTTQVEAAEAVEQLALVATSLADYQKARAAESQQLLFDPLVQWERRRPYKRAMMALESYDRGLEELIKSLPESCPVSGTAALEIFSPLVSRLA